MSASRRAAVILDRDGTIVREEHYLASPCQLSLLENASAGLQMLANSGLTMVVVTNQSGVGRGFFTEQDLALVHHRLVEMLLEEGVVLDGIYHCPHSPAIGCSCRKPGTLLVNQAAEEHDFDPALSYYVGDKECDVELGRRAGGTAVLVRTGYGRELEREGDHTAQFVADDLLQAARYIVEDHRTRLGSLSR